MSDAPESFNKGSSERKKSGREFISDRYFRLSVTALIFVAFAFSSFEYITGKHRPDPFELIEPVTSWAWWRYPLPEESAEVMPWPVGAFGRFIQRDDYGESHAIEIKPGEARAKLGESETIMLADFAPFVDGSAWALDTEGKLYNKTSEGDWQEHEISLIRRVEEQQAAPTISGQMLAKPETNAPIVWSGFSLDGNILVVLTEEQEILAWSVSRGDWLWREMLNDDIVGTPSFASNRPLVMFPGRRGITVFDWNNGNVINQLRSLKTQFTAAAFVPSGEILTWDEASGFQIWALGSKGPVGRPGFRVRDRVNRIVVNPDGKFVAIGTQFEIFLIDFESGKTVSSMVAERGFQVRDFTFTRGGTGLIYHDESGVQILDVESGKSERRWRPLQVLNWAPVNNIILGLEGKNELTLWQYQDDEFASYPIAGGTMVAALSPAGDLIAVQADREPIRVFGRRERGIGTQLDYGGQRSRQISFNSDGNVLMVVQDNGDLTLWDVGLVAPQTKSVEVPIKIAGQSIRALHFINSSTGWVISDQEQLLSTLDAGNTWQQPLGTLLRKEGAPEKLRDVFFASQLTGWVVGDAGMIARTTDGGASWIKVESPSNANLHAVHFTNQDSGIAVGEQGTILRTGDGGQTWNKLDAAVDQELHSVILLANDVGWISAVDSGDDLAPVLKTADGGQTWKQVDFNELPAPLLLFIGIPLFALAVFVVFYKKPQIVETTGVDPVGTSDKPIGWDDPDPLQFKPIAKGLSYFLRNQDTEPPLTIGINGPWGTGKSSLMNLLMEDLRQYGCSPVWFNAWHHQKEEHLLAALLENIRKQAVPEFWQRDGIMFRLRLLWLRSRSEIKMTASLVLALLGLALLDQIFSDGRLQAAFLNFNSASLDKLPGVLDAFLTAQTGVISGGLAFATWLMFRLRVLPSNPAKLLAGLGNRASVSGFRDQLGFRYKFGGEFKDVCKALRSRNTPGLVIMIDDLDRCQPPNVLEVLEAVNYLATVGDCFIILGMARRQVENCIAIGFKDFIVEGMEEQEHGLLQVNKLKVSEPAVQLAKVKTASNPGDEDPPATIIDPDTENSSHATDNQRQFARRYLEKLINIEVAVPRGNPDQAAGLFAPEKVDSGSDSRFRQRQLLHKATGLVQVVAMVFLLGVIGAGVAPLLPQKDDSDQQNANQTRVDGSGPDPEPVVIVEPVTVINNPDEPVTPRQGEPITVAAPPLSIRQVAHTSLTGERSLWTWWGPPVLVFATIMLFLIRRRLRPADTNIQDTDGFTEALKRWYPLIYAVNPTPRAIKRFENRIRYIAMQARPPQQMPDFIDRIIDGFENRWAKLLQRKTHQMVDDKATVQAQKFKIDDEMLVALGAVEALDPNTIMEKGTNEIKQLVIKSTSKLLEQIRATEPKDDDQFVAQLNNLNEFFDAGKAWPPEQQDLIDYRRLSGQIRG